jgi:N6-adenosine-specific RNA methylase IME4
MAADNCAMAMWTTGPMWPEALKLLSAWGFEYKTVLFTWVKTTKTGKLFWGMGHHTRSNAEFCLLGVRGKGIRRENAGVLSVALEQRLEHSRKPAHFRNALVTLYGDIPRIEMFARESSPGWDSWGNETTKFDEEGE